MAVTTQVRILVWTYLFVLGSTNFFKKARARNMLAANAKGHKGSWCSGITSASHAEGSGFKSQRVHLLSEHDSFLIAFLRWRIEPPTSRV